MSRPERALVIVHSYYLRDSRAHRHASALAERGWEIDVVCARGPHEPRTEKIGRIHIWRMPAQRRGGSAVRKLFEYCSFATMGFFAATALWARRRHRLVYVLGLPNFIVFCALVPRLFGTRVLLDMRDPFPEFYLSKYGGIGRRHPPRWLLAEEWASTHFASHVLTAHPSMAAVYQRSIDPSRITVVFNAPDPRLFAGDGSQRREGGRDNRTLLYMGTVTYPYGVDLAVLAVSKLRERIPNLRLRIVGHGELAETVAKLADAEGVADRVTIESFVPAEQVAGIVREAWLGVQPNRDLPIMRTSLSTKILEWCLLGLPVVAGRTPPLAETFANDEILLHEPGDVDGLCARIEEAHADPDALAERAKRARRIVEGFRYEEQIETFVRVAKGA